MTAIPRKYITDAKNQKQAVIVDLETFNRMESIIEDNGLAKFMEEAEKDETFSVHEAKKHYRSLKKGWDDGVGFKKIVLKDPAAFQNVIVPDWATGLWRDSLIG